VTHIAVIGTGYVGLSTAVGLAELGHAVVGVDIDEHKISTLQSGVSPLDEAGITDAQQRS
jgi:UDPglucose 6-dehydrogenase